MRSAVELGGRLGGRALGSAYVQADRDGPRRCARLGHGHGDDGDPGRRDPRRVRAGDQERHHERDRQCHQQRQPVTGSRCRLRGDGGAAVAEFVMISVLLVFLLFAVVQVAVLFYVRNVVAASAADGARYAASSNVDRGRRRHSGHRRRGSARSRARLRARSRAPARSARDPASGLQTTVVHCAGNDPVGLPAAGRGRPHRRHRPRADRAAVVTRCPRLRAATPAAAGGGTAATRCRAR